MSEFHRSDMWRGQAFADRAKEVAHVTSGISDYFGTVAGDRTYKVTWKPIAGIARTTIGQKRVEINPEVLDGKPCPFDGQFVDTLMGYAAHEAGHAMLVPSIDHAGRGWGSACRDPLQRMISNLVQDLAIDGQPMMEWNKGIGELTAAMRRDMQADQKATIADAWANAGPLSIEQLLKLWGCALLVRAPEVLTSTGREYEYGIVQRLNPIGLRIQRSKQPIQLDPTKSSVSWMQPYRLNGALGSAIVAACDEILAICQGYTQPQLPLGSPSEGQGSPSDAKGQKGSGDEGASKKTPEPRKEDGTGGSSSSQQEEEGDEEDAGEDGDEASPSGDEEEDSASDGKDEGDGSDGAGDGEGDADSDEADGTIGEEAKGAGGSGAGKATPGIPVLCPTNHTDEEVHERAPLSKEERQFWNDVLNEIERLEAESMLEQGVSRREAERLLAPFIDDEIVKRIEKSWRRLSSDPSRKRRVTQGRIDRRNVVLAGGRSDIFNTKGQERLEGTLCLVLDLSGSTGGSQVLIKQAAASVYTALAHTDVDTYIYTYGLPICAKLATPTMLADFTEISSNGGTPSGEALCTVIEEVRPKGRSIILHVTDGDAHNPIAMTTAFAEAAKGGWTIITVLVGSCNAALATRESEQHGFPEPVKLGSYQELPELLDEVVTGLLREAKR